MPRLISFSLKTSSAAVTRSSVSACSVTPSSPAHAMLALVPRKSKRWASSLPAWFRALSTSWWSTLLTMSNDESAMALFLRSGDAPPAPRGCGPPLLYAAPVPPHGGLPEWPKGADCKSVGSAYKGSNPSPATPGTTALRLLVGGPSPCQAASGGGGGPGAGDGGALQRPPAQEQPAERD